VTRGKHGSNIVEVLRAVCALGGTTTAIVRGGKHIQLRVVTRLGNRTTLYLSKARVEPYKLRGWTRQEMRRADNQHRRLPDE